MGKYRTFSNKAILLNGEVHGDLCRNKGLFNGNGLSDFKKTRLLQIRSEIEWQKWKERRFNRGLLQRQPLLLTLIVFGCFLSLSNAQPTIKVNSTEKLDAIRDINHTRRASNYSDFPFFLKSLPNCTRPSSDQFPPDLFSKHQRQNGAIAIHFLVTFYMLYALLLVCDHYFVPAIEIICEELRIPHNIAGATLMAISTSAPELFTNVIGTFVTKGDLGVGTIVGSAVFNVLAVGGAIGIGTNIAVQKSQIVNPHAKRAKKKGVLLEWWSLTRDSFYYVLSVVILIAILYDGRVYWQEAMIMLFIYAFYIMGMWYDEQCKGIVGTLVKKVGKAFNCESSPSRKLSIVIRTKMMESDVESSPLINGTRGSMYGTGENQWADLEGIKEIDNVLRPAINGSKSSIHSKSSSQSRKVSLAAVTEIPNELDSTSVSSNDSEGSNDSVSSSMMIMGTMKDIIVFPLKLALSWTIPDCRQETKRKWCAVSLLCCVGWIAGLSYVISWMVCIIGETFGIPDSVSGLTFLAAGTSLPEVISSVIVARQGLGSMGLSNSVGSNTFDVLVCLGLPWLIKSAILTSQDTNYIEIHSGGLEYSAISLISTFLLVYLIIALNGYVIDTKVGVACVILYVIFIIFACMLEMNMFFPVNLPPC